MREGVEGIGSWQNRMRRWRTGRDARALYDRGRRDVEPAEIYWLLFLARASGEAELLGAHKTRQLLPPVEKRKVIPAASLAFPANVNDYDFMNVVFEAAEEPGEKE